MFELEKIEEFYKAYVLAGLSDSSNAKFLKSLLNEKTPPRGRGIDWLESIFNKGMPCAPTKENLEFSEHLLEIAKKLQYEEERNTLQEFSKKISIGQQLTEKQRKYMDVLIERANSGFTLVKIDDSIENFIRAIEGKIKFGVSGYYWNSRPGTYRKLCMIFEQFDKKNEISNNDIKFLREIFSSWTTSWDTVESLAGRLMYYKNEPVLVVGNKRHNGSGIILVDVIYCGITTSVNVSSLQKRMKKS